MWLVDTAPTFGVNFGTGASVGAVTVTITRSDGTVVVTDVAATDNTDGTYSYQLSVANNTKLDRLRLDWKITATNEVIPLHEEIVGSLLFTIDQARNKTISGQQKPLSSSTAYPDPDIARMRDLIAKQFEAKTGRSWVSRYCRTQLHGTGGREVNLLHGHSADVFGNQTGGPGRIYDIQRLISVTVDDVAQSLPDFIIHGRKVVNLAGMWPRATATNPFNVVIEYEYGDLVVNPEANENGLRVALANLVPSDVSSYAQSFSGADGTVSYPRGGLVWPSKTWEWFKRNPRPRIPTVA